MSPTPTQTPAATTAPVHADATSTHRVTLPRVIRSEWIKLRSVRSTIITFAFAAVAVVAFGVLVTMLSDGGGVGDDGPVVPDPIGNSLAGTHLAQLVLGVAGALFITAEHSTGLIRTTFTAVPKRLPVLWAKALVVSGAAAATMGAAVLVAFVAGQALYGGEGPGASLLDPGVPRALLGAAVLPTAIAVMGVALGALLRSTATAVGVLVAMLFIVPLLLGSLGGVWADLVSYLPSEAGQSMSTMVDDPEQLSPLAGFGVVLGWVVALLGFAALALKRRDA